MCIVLQCVQSWQYWMRHLESSPVLSTPEITQAIRNVAGKSQQVKETGSWWSSKIWAFHVAEKRALAIILKFKMASLLMITMMEEDVVTVDQLDITRCLRAWRCCLCLVVVTGSGFVDLRQLTFKQTILPQSLVSGQKNKEKIRRGRANSDCCDNLQWINQRPFPHKLFISALAVSVY